MLQIKIWILAVPCPEQIARLSTVPQTSANLPLVTSYDMLKVALGMFFPLTIVQAAAIISGTY